MTPLRAHHMFEHRYYGLTEPTSTLLIALGSSLTGIQPLNCTTHKAMGIDGRATTHPPSYRAILQNAHFTTLEGMAATKGRP